MMHDPLKPILQVNPVLPYDYTSWCCNYIWLHKQPLFLWQMAASMKIFGVNEIALRLPSSIMGAIAVYLVFDMAKQIIKNIDVAFLSAVLFSFSYYEIELNSGLLPLDQNDATFLFYITASFWAFTRYVNSKSFKWVILIRIFSGAAMLYKWLIGSLIFSGWGISVIADAEKRKQIKNYLPILYAFLIAAAIF